MPASGRLYATAITRNRWEELAAFIAVTAGSIRIFTAPPAARSCQPAPPGELEAADGPGQPLRLLLEGQRGRRRLLHQPRVLLRHALQPPQRPLDLLHARALLLGRDRHLPDQIAHLSHARHDLVDDLAGPLH